MESFGTPPTSGTHSCTGRCDEVKWSSTFANIFKHLVGEEFLCEVWVSTHKLVDFLFCSTCKLGCGRSLSQPILNISVTKFNEVYIMKLYKNGKYMQLKSQIWIGWYDYAKVEFFERG